MKSLPFTHTGGSGLSGSLLSQLLEAWLLFHSLVRCFLDSS
jgi:hypothetical protein